MEKDKLAKVKEGFKQFDKDGDGTIRKEDLGNMLKLMEMNPSDKELELIMDEFCQDDSDKIDLPTFAKLMRGMSTDFDS